MTGNVIQPNGAVSGGGISYSTSETLTGDTWINGKPIYCKVVATGALPNATTKTVLTGLSGTINMVNYKGIAYNQSGGTTLLLPSVHKTQSYSISLSVSYNGASIYLECNEDRSNYTESYVTLYYTKS